MTDFRAAFPDLNFWGAADLIAEGKYVVGRWEGGGTHTGPAFNDFLIGSLPAATGRKMHFTGTTVLKIENGKIVEVIGLDDGVAALQQLGLFKTVRLHSWFKCYLRDHGIHDAQRPVCFEKIGDVHGLMLTGAQAILGRDTDRSAVAGIA